MKLEPKNFHDLRTPLAKAKTYLLLLEAENPQGSEFLKKALAKLVEAEKIIHELELEQSSK